MKESKSYKIKDEMEVRCKNCLNSLPSGEWMVVVIFLIDVRFTVNLDYIYASTDILVVKH